MTSSTAPWARFDDLLAGTAVQCDSAHDVLVAERPEQVAGVLAEVERATDAGQWAFGYVAYEAAAGLDPHLLVHPTTPLGMPLAWFGLCDEPTPVPPLDTDGQLVTPGSAEWRQAWTPAGHADDVAAVRDRIAVGDTYQCNLTVRVIGRVQGDPFRLYRNLALGQRGAYNAFLDMGRFVVASASPELFFERSGDRILTRPMKGTAPRGRFLQEDEVLARRLRLSAKEQAENVMIVDLVRNDLARVAEVGSVAVPALFRVERYETVLQLTSDVVARLRPDTGILELFRALFPCGSVTGAPKVSSMDIIRSLEPTPRGVYCGAVGLVGPPHARVRTRFNVAIRTAVVDTETGEALYGTGGGITWDSEPTAEHAEVVTKSAILTSGSREFELLETMLFEPDQGLVNRDRHLRRMAESAEHLQFRFHLPAVVRALQARVTGGDAARVRLRLHRTGRVGVDVLPLAAARPGPVLLALDDELVDPRGGWLYHKTTDREPYDRRRRRRPEVDDVIMVNTSQELTEVTRATLALQLGEDWYTSPLTSGCLPGVERARLLELGVLHERVLRPADLRTARDVAVISSLRGWRRARLDDGRCGAAGAASVHHRDG